MRPPQGNENNTPDFGVTFCGHLCLFFSDCASSEHPDSEWGQRNLLFYSGGLGASGQDAGGLECPRLFVGKSDFIFRNWIKSLQEGGGLGGLSTLFSTHPVTSFQFLRTDTYNIPQGTGVHLHLRECKLARSVLLFPSEQIAKLWAFSATFWKTHCLPSTQSSEFLRKLGTSNDIHFTPGCACERFSVNSCV